VSPERTRGVVELDAIRLHYVEAGDGPLVVCVHGFPSCSASFHFQVDALARDHRVVAIDALGANRSSKPEDLSAYRVERLVDQLDRFVLAVGGTDPYSLIGHDWGAAMAWAYAQALPDRLSGLIAIAAPPYNQLIELLRTSEEQRTRSTYMWSMRSGSHHRFMTGNGGRDLWEYAYAPLRGLPHVGPDLDEQFRDALAVPGAIDAGINWYRANIPDTDQLDDFEAWPSRWASTPSPVLEIWGEDDRTFVPTFLDGLANYADDVEVYRMANTGHWPMIEHPDEVNQVIRAFLARTVTTR
jgi:pimeloyl-ACP methyl ester carboxylesterase